MNTTVSPTCMDRLLYGLTAQQLKIERRTFISYAFRSFLLVNVNLFLSALSVLFQCIRYVALRLRIAVTWMRLKRLDRFRNDKRVIRLYRQLDTYQYQCDGVKISINSETRTWLHRLVFEWRTRIRSFWKILASFRRSLRRPKQIQAGLHNAPTQLKLANLIPTQRVYQLSAAGVVLFALIGQLGVPFLSSGKANARVSALSHNKQVDLAVPSWAMAVAPWKGLVNEVAHDSRIVVTRDKRQTNILSESVITVSNTDKVALQRYTPGQERLLYLLILLGSNGNAKYKNGLCPLDVARVRKITRQINTTAGSPVGSITGKDGARNSLTMCGYLLNSISDQLLSSPIAGTRYAGSVPTQFARDLAYNWATGSVASRTTFANTFAKLYADWSKPASPTYTKLRKG